jgi:hypothetical protein
MAEDNEQQSPFTRPGFVAATVVIALIVVLGLVIVIVNMTRDDPDPAPPTSTSAEPTTAAPTSEPPEAAGGASVCGLPGEVLEGTLSAAPAAEWAFQSSGRERRTPTACGTASSTLPKALCSQPRTPSSKAATPSW